MLNETHSPALESWVEGAGDTDFPVQNLPFGAYADPQTGRGRIGIAIGDRILDVARARSAGVIGGAADDAAGACEGETLNAFMAMGGGHWSALRKAASRALRNDTAEGEAAQAAADDILVAMADVEMLLPARIGDFTDFYASLHHATNVGRMLRPDNPLMPNYKYVPVAYHGRASSVVASGAPCLRPVGQSKGGDEPSFGPTRALDFETEMGVYVGPGNPMGQPVSIAEADAHLFGLCILNDWSARDVQAWEYQPLGPFLAKSFVTHVSPWVVTLEALAPFRCSPAPRDPGDPRLLRYLSPPSAAVAFYGAFDVHVEVLLASRRMRDEGVPPATLTVTNMRHLYWTIFQMLTHHSSNGCNMRPGDLIGTGTISGPGSDSLGCLLEITKRGSEPLPLPTGEERKFLEDGDELTMRAWCAGEYRIGFGECRAVVEGVRS